MPESLTHALVLLICIFSLVTWRAKRILREFDKGGAIKGAAQKATAKGVSSMIGRFLK